MKKADVKEIVYKIYESLQQEEYEPINNKNKPPVVVGGIYFTVLNKKLVYYIIIRQVGTYYECFKMSNFYEFAKHYDVFYRLRLDNQLFIIQTDMNFYLSPEEIQNSILLETADQQFVKSLTKFRYMSDREKIEQKELKNGFYYPFGNKYVEMFKDKELDIVKDYHLRIFEILFAD